MKKFLYILGGVILLLVIVAAILPFVIDVNRFRPDIERLMGQALNRKVTIGDIQLSLLSGGVGVNDLTISDDPAFSQQPFLTAKSVTVGVEMQPLIFSRDLRITGLTIEQPQATLLHNAAGDWNFSTLGASSSNDSAKPAAQPQTASGNPGAASSSPTQSFAIQKLTIHNGTVNVGTAGGKGKIYKYDGVNLTASNLSYTSQFPFELTAGTPGNGSLSVKGQAGPLNQTDTQKTAFDGSLEAKNLDLGATGFVDPGAGIAGVVDFSGTVASDGKTVTTKGTATANKLQLVPGGSPATQPVQLAYQTDYSIAGRSGVLKQGDVRIGKALAQLTGNYRSEGDNTLLQMKLKSNSMPVTDVSSLLPALGVILPPGATLREGTMNMDLTINGPADKLTTSGPVNLSNAKLANFDLGSKMKALSRFTGIQSTQDTVIQTLASNLRIATDGIRADDFNLIVPAIGSLTGSGTISPKQELNFKMTAKLVEGSSAPLGKLAELAGRAGINATANGIPFNIRGTTSNPVFVPDVAGIVSGIAAGRGAGASDTSGSKPALPTSKDLRDALGGIFGRKPKQ